MVTILEPGARVRPMRAVAHDPVDVRRRETELDADHRLFRTAQPSEIAGGCRTLHRIGVRPWIVAVLDLDAVRDPGRGGLETDLRVRRIGAEEPEAHAGVTSGFHRIAHLFRP